MVCPFALINIDGFVDVPIVPAVTFPLQVSVPSTMRPAEMEVKTFLSHIFVKLLSRHIQNLMGLGNDSDILDGSERGILKFYQHL